jgi:steroid delta-isomerase-like uncharacterized protein
MTEENKASIRRFLMELDKDLSAVGEFFSPDCVAHLPGSHGPANREGFKQFVTSLYTAFPDLRHTVEDQIAEGDKVVTRLTARGSHQGSFQGVGPTGRQVAIRDIMITRIKAGQIIELWAQFDALGLLQQLGVLPPPG